MAKALKNMKVGYCRYPWDKWLDGQVWELKRGVDFDTTLESFVGTARKAARARKMRLATSLLQPDMIYIQAMARNSK